jgi:hypothetical protein
VFFSSADTTNVSDCGIVAPRNALIQEGRAKIKQQVRMNTRPAEGAGGSSSVFAIQLTFDR